MVRLSRLGLLRQRKALTQQQLADRAGVNRVTVARLESGRDDPFPTTVRKLADALGVDPEELMAPRSLQPDAGEPASGFRAGVRPPATLPPGEVESAGRLEVLDRPRVSRLLRENPDLEMLVSEAANRLVDYFPDARLTLQLITDPEYGEGEELLLGISTNLPDDDALESLRRFDEEWWVHHAPRASALLCIDLSAT
jgi:transcriptional regulator with XRE-family HTH domain